VRGSSVGPLVVQLDNATPIIESREVSYFWHPWYARTVAVHETFTRNGRAVFQCGLD
jgi:hypothetical protein